MITHALAPRGRRRLAPLLALAVLASTLPFVLSPAEPAEAVAEAVVPGFRTQTLVSGLNQPTNLEFAPDGRIFVVEKRGTLVALDGLSDTSPDLVADLSGNVHNYEDRGLLGLEVDPAFPTDPYLYVLYALDEANSWGDDCPNPPGTFDDGCVVDARLSRLEVDGENDLVGGEQVLLEGNWCAQYPSHTIGDLDFAADGSLLVSAGDGADYNSVDYGQNGGDPDSPTPANPCGDPPGGTGTALSPPTAQGGALRSQDLMTAGDPVTFDGTVLRVDPETGEARPGNPLSGGDPGDDRIIAHGLRNPFRFAARPGTDEVWVGDVGWGTWEEINRIPAATDATVENFGWPCYEGADPQSTYSGLGLDMCEGLYDGTTASAVREPYFAYRHGLPPDPDRCGTAPGGSVTSVAFYDEGTYPEAYDGGLFFADYTRGCIWSMPADEFGEPDTGQVHTLVTGAYPVDIEVGPGSDLYWLDILEGSIGRIGYHGTDVPPTARAEVDVDNGPTPLTVAFDATASTSAVPGELAFDWDLDGDGEFDDSTSATPGWAYETAGDVTARVRVTDEQGGTDEAQVVIHAGNSRPVPAIGAPAATAMWAVDDVVAFAGAALDADDGALAAGALDWQVNLHHCATPSDCHVHPFQSFDGVADGSFVTPNHEYPSYIELVLTATDTTGLTGATAVRLDPATVAVQFTSEPAGLQVSVGSRTATTPFTQTVIAGSYATVAAPSPQFAAGQAHRFTGWSDGGEAVHQVTMTAATTFHATYEPVAIEPPADTLYVSDMDWTSEENGFGPAERDMSNGDAEAGDGVTLSIGGQTFEKGVGAHAASAITVAVPPECSRFDAAVGLDDEVGDNGSVAFTVSGDGAELASTPTLTGADALVPLTADVAGIDELTLAIDDAGDNDWWDHADWADARLSCGAVDPDPTTTTTAPTTTTTAPTTTTPPPPGVVYASDLPWTTEVNGFGPPERDRSNGSMATGDGGPLRLDGEEYAKGIGAHANSTIELAVPPACTRFDAVVGVDDGAGANGTVTFAIAGDGTELASTATLVGGGGAEAIGADVTGVTTLTLAVDDTGDNNWWDHGDWADARFTCGPGATTTTTTGPTTTTTTAPPTGPSTVYASDLDWTEDENGYGPAERDMSNGDGDEGDGAPLSIGGQAFDKGIGAHADSTITFAVPPECTRFDTVVGLDDEVGDNGTVTFTVSGDGDELAATETLEGEDPGEPVSVDVADVEELTLTIDDTGDNNWWDHGDWADARFTCGGGGTTTTTGATTTTAAPTTTTTAPPTGSWGAPTSLPTGDRTHSVVASDLDGDGDRDLVAASAGGNAAVVVRNDGGTFAPAVSYPTGAGTFPKHVEVGDLTGDGVPDLVTANQDSTTGVDVTVFAGNSDATFGPGVAYEACERPHQAAIGDIDGDGDEDVVVACWGGSVVSVLANDGSGGLAAPIDHTAGDAPHSLVLRDFDGDADLDVAVAALGDNRVAVLEGAGDGSFGAPTLLWPGLGPHNILSEDVDGDGHGDLVVTAQASGTVGVITGNGDGTFDDADFYDVGPVPKAAALGDVDGDGDADLVAVNTHENYPDGSAPTTLTVLRGGGDGTFGPGFDLPNDLTPFNVVVTDLGGGPANEIVTANWHSGDLKVWSRD